MHEESLQPAVVDLAILVSLSDSPDEFNRNASPSTVFIWITSHGIQTENTDIKLQKEIEEEHKKVIYFIIVRFVIINVVTLTSDYEKDSE